MATAAAAMAAKARRDVENLFFDNNAFAPDRAIGFEPRMGIQQRYLEQLIAEGVVHEVEPGRYWLNLERYNAMRRERAVWTMRVIVAAVVVTVAIVAIRLALKLN
jgi:hypothetical protein